MDESSTQWLHSFDLLALKHFRFWLPYAMREPDSASALLIQALLDLDPKYATSPTSNPGVTNTTVARVTTNSEAPVTKFINTQGIVPIRSPTKAVTSSCAMGCRLWTRFAA